MPRFGKKSKDQLSTCHPELQRLFKEVIKHWDCTVLEGYRGKEAQNEAFRTGRSTLKYPKSNHNHTATQKDVKEGIASKVGQPLSLGVDVAPYFATSPHIRWNDLEAFRAFGGFVLGVASQMGIPIRWGGDWNGNRDFKDQSFVDLPHFELSKKK